MGLCFGLRRGVYTGVKGSGWWHARIASRVVTGGYSYTSRRDLLLQENTGTNYCRNVLDAPRERNQDFDEKKRPMDCVPKQTHHPQISSTLSKDLNVRKVCITLLLSPSPRFL